jgi:4-amino-4-deoxychorismate lyase
MSLLIETIKISGGQFHNLAFHNERINTARKVLFGCNDTLSIAEHISIPPEQGSGIYKCTVKYSNTIGEAEFISYTIRTIRNLKVVECNSIDYAYKFADRTLLSNLFQQRGECDEILIIKNGLITDTSFSNIIFYDGEKWITPKKPLLKGTKREKLLREGLLKEEDLGTDDLKRFSKACLINSMLEINDSCIDIERILC